MRILLPLFLLNVSAALATAQQAEALYSGDLSPTHSLPTYEHGFVAVYDHLDNKVYAPDGSLLFRSTFGPHEVTNIAMDSDGSAALAIENPDESLPAGAVQLVDSKGNQTRWIDTSGYRPLGVSFAPDHSLWVLGDDRKREGSFLLHHHARDGREIGQYLPADAFHCTADFDPALHGGWLVRTSRDKVGVFLRCNRRQNSWWVELTFDGKEAGRWRADFDGHPVAFTDGGQVYATSVGGILILDRESASWKPANIAPLGSLVGADGDALVFVEYPRRLRKVTPGT
jgi:hypothetical protein